MLFVFIFLLGFVANHSCSREKERDLSLYKFLGFVGLLGAFFFLQPPKGNSVGLFGLATSLFLVILKALKIICCLVC